MRSIKRNRVSRISCLCLAVLTAGTLSACNVKAHSPRRPADSTAEIVTEITDSAEQTAEPMTSVLTTTTVTTTAPTTPAATTGTTVMTSSLSTTPATETRATESTQSAPAAVSFRKYTDTVTDAEGYNIRKVLTISPWISNQDSAKLKAAWSKVSHGKAFPSLASMGITETTLKHFATVHIDYDEVFYAVGTIDIYNETAGYDITQTNTRDVPINIKGAHKYMTMQILYSNDVRNYWSINEYQGFGWFGRSSDGGTGTPSMLMQSNHWGPCPFVIAFVIDKTPNHPNGDPSISDCVFKFGDNEFSLVS